MSWAGTPGRIEALPNLSPEQQELFGQLIQALSGQGGLLEGGLQNLQKMLTGDASEFEAPAMRQFNEQIVPGIAERFSGMGEGGQQSSAFGQQLGAAGAGLSENLAMQRANMQQQGLQQLMQMLGLGMQSQFQYQQIPGQEGFMQPFAQGVGSALPGAVMGGAPGAAKGVADWASKKFLNQ